MKYFIIIVIIFISYWWINKYWLYKHFGARHSSWYGACCMINSKSQTDKLADGGKCNPVWWTVYPFLIVFFLWWKTLITLHIQADGGPRLARPAAQSHLCADNVMYGDVPPRIFSSVTKTDTGGGVKPGALCRPAPPPPPHPQPPTTNHQPPMLAFAPCSYCPPSPPPTPHFTALCYFLLFHWWHPALIDCAG